MDPIGCISRGVNGALLSDRTDNVVVVSAAHSHQGPFLYRSVGLEHISAVLGQFDQRMHLGLCKATTRAHIWTFENHA